jgi:hypothetical protein
MSVTATVTDTTPFDDVYFLVIAFLFTNTQHPKKKIIVGAGLILLVSFIYHPDSRQSHAENTCPYSCKYKAL